MKKGFISGLLAEFRDSLSSTVTFPADYFGGWFGVAPSESGVDVNELTAMQCAAFAGGIRLIADALSVVPLNVYERISATEERIALDHPLQFLLNMQPNPETTSADWRQTGMFHILLTGNAYFEKAYNGAGEVGGLYVRSPFATFPWRRVDAKLDRSELQPGALVYKTTDTPQHYERQIEMQDMVHVRGMGLDSLVGLSLVKYIAREVLGLDLAAQSYSAKYFANQAIPSGYLTTTAMRSPDQKLNDVKTWVAAHSRGQSHSMAILDGGMEFKSVSSDPEKTQLTQVREWNRTQIACLLGVPPHFLGEAAESRANMEQRALEFLTFTMKPWYNKWEQSLNARLFPKTGRNANRYFCKFDTAQFERATYADLLKGIQMGRYASLITTQEGRKMLGLPPYSKEQMASQDPADKLIYPVNMAFVTEDWDKEPEPQPAAGKGQGGNDQDGGDGGSKPASGTSQGGKREIDHYYRMFSPVFSSAFARIRARKDPVQKDYETVFAPVLTAVASAFELAPESNPDEMRLDVGTPEFIREYIKSMAHRSKVWTEADMEPELRRAIEVLREKCQPVAVEEESE